MAPTMTVKEMYDLLNCYIFVVITMCIQGLEMNIPEAEAMETEGHKEVPTFFFKLSILMIQTKIGEEAIFDGMDTEPAPNNDPLEMVINEPLKPRQEVVTDAMETVDPTSSGLSKIRSKINNRATVKSLIEVDQKV
jgi:hypothetical protein